MRASLEVFSLDTGQTRVVLQTDRLIEAPNFHPSGQWLMVNGDGQLFRVPLDQPALHLIPGTTGRCNNDHGFLPAGTVIYSAHRGQGAEIFRLDDPTPISPQPPSWFHGTAPDGKSMTYAAARHGSTVDIYAKPFDGPEQRMTGGEGHSDGPDYSADGSQIFYNCDRTGHAQIWVMDANGTNHRHLFRDANVNWFPHPSPDGQHLVYLAYPPGTQGHPRDLPVALCLCAPDGTGRRRVLEFLGGQGSLNVPCWSPDSAAFAFMRYFQPEDAMPVTSKDLIDAANAAVPRISGAEAQAKLAAGAVLIDIRDSAELAASGKAVGSVHIPRGSLEFKADPSLPSHDPALQFDRPIVLHCAAGGRAALAGKLLQDMGYTQVFNLGGFKDWVEADGPVEKA